MNEMLIRFITGAILVSVVISATLFHISTSVLFWSLITILGIKELWENSMAGVFAIMSLILVGVFLIGIGYVQFENGSFNLDFSNYNGINIVAFLCVIWTNDSSAYLGGRLLGKTIFTKGLSPSISPNKSWEGAIIGWIFSSIVAYCFIGKLGLILGPYIAILATYSDLIESKAKRQANIKDSGNILPGHGGILDRFDALLLSAPFTFIVIFILSQ